MFTGCKFAVAPNESWMVHRIIVNITESVLHTVNVNNTSSTTAIVIHQHEQGPVANCHVKSLEVYRGRQQTLDIGQNHGFSITDEGTIEVSILSSTHQSHHIFFIIILLFLNNDQIDRNNAIYTVKELQGELYRMNLSCSRMESGCLFFKTAGVANITHGSFLTITISTYIFHIVMPVIL